VGDEANPDWREVPPPAAPRAVDDDKMWNVLCHVGGLAYFFPLAWIVAPLVIWLVRRERSASTDEHGRRAVNFQISITIYAGVPYLLGTMFLFAFTASRPFEYGFGMAWSVLPFFLLTAIVVVFDVVQIILAAVAANAGRMHTYPLSIPFITKEDGAPPST
jgi:uncharacterized protein